MSCGSSWTPLVWVPPTGWNPSGTSCSSEGSPQGHKSCQQTYSTMESGLLSPWSHRSCQETAPVWASHRVTASFGHPSALVWGPPRAAGGSVRLHAPPRAAGGSLLLHVTSKGCRGISAPPCTSKGDRGIISALAPGAPSPLLLHWPWYLKNYFPHIFSLLSVASVVQQLCPLLIDITTAVLPPLLMDSALASSGFLLELAGIGSVGHGGSIWLLLTEATLVALSTTKTLMCKLNTLKYKKIVLLSSFLCFTGAMKWETSV